MSSMPHEWPDAERDQAIKLWMDGKSASEVGRAIGRSRNAVCGKMHRLGLGRSERAVKESVSRPKVVRAPKPKAPPKPAPKPKPVLRVIAPPPPALVSLDHARPFMSRASRECAWLLDDGRSCCAPISGAGSYCAGHRALVYRRTEKLDAKKLARKFG